MTITNWKEVAGQLGSEEEILSLVVFDGSLYGGTCCLGKLYKGIASFDLNCDDNVNSWSKEDVFA